LKGVVFDTGALIALERGARPVGLMLGRARRSDVVDGHVALCALCLRQVVLTSHPDGLLSLVPGLKIETV
jgi:hypothetical protein